MRRIIQYFNTFLKLGTLISTVLLVISVLVQIYARFFMESAPSWTEEASRLFFIYAISFASGLAFKQNYFVALDVISSRLSNRWNAIFVVLVDGLVFLLFIFISIHSIKYIQLGLAERSPSLGFNMSFSFASMLLLSASISIFVGIRFFHSFRKLL